MSYLEDWVRENQGLGRDEVTRRMLGAGYQKSEIDAAWRHRGRRKAGQSEPVPEVGAPLPGLPAWLTVPRIAFIGVGMAVAILVTVSMLGWVQIDWVRWIVILGALSLWIPRVRKRLSKPPSAPPPAPGNRSDVDQQ